ncbi:MAG: VCBS repeat-containing protein [Gammaproteobacteria bacterium]|nr:VCBS repeat-containing protein [Gammaproteobacteria bacterium]
MIYKYLLKITSIVAIFGFYQYFAASSTNPEQQKKLDAVIVNVNKYCGACHKVPSPTVMPKKYWPAAIKAMVDIADRRMGANTIPPEIVKDIKAFYYGSSPETLDVLPIHKDTNQPLTFSTTELGEKSPLPLVINIKSVELDETGNNQFLISDGERNEVSILTVTKTDWQETLLTEIPIASHTEVIDYDKDGDKDIIISALGHFPPSDKLAGKIFLMRNTADGKYDKEILLEDVGRITDARPVDIDNDDDLDLAVAIFGGGDVGELAWLENLGNGKYKKHSIVKVSGALNVSPVDLNNDGNMDIVTLISQEYEMVVALINNGKGEFQQAPLAQAPHPMYGSTSMRLVDMDGDKDIDILFSNGDALDLQPDPKPYHGIQWLENTGNLKFQFREIGRFYGTSIAVAGDLDADGDMDIVAASWNNYWQDPARQSMIWFENDGKQNFSRHNIIHEPQSIVSIELKDVTGDNQLDIIAGIFRIDLWIKKFAEKDNNKEQKDSKITEQEILLPRVIMLENQRTTEGTKFSKIN